MKIEPIMYLVTFADGDEFFIKNVFRGDDSWRVKDVLDSDLFLHNDLTFDVCGISEDDTIFRLSDAIVSLNKWKEKQNED